MSILRPESPQQLRAVLEHIVSEAPKGVNPFAIVRAEMASAVSYQPTRSVNPLLILGSVLLGVCSVIFALSFIFRARRGSLWMFRVVRVGQENFVLGSLITNKGGWDCICSMTLQIFVWLAYRGNEGHIIEHRILAYILPWLPGGVAASMAIWCLSVTYILHLRTYSSETARVPWYLSAAFVNTVGISLPFVLLVSTLPLTVMASLSYDSGMDNYFGFDSLLAQAQQAWKPSTREHLDALDEASLILFAALVDFGDAATWFKRTYWALTAWCGAFTLGFFVVGWLYARALQRSIDELSSRSADSVGYKAFTRTRRWLVSISFCFVVTMAAVCIHSAWISVYCDRMLTDGLLNELAIVLPVLTIAVLGLPVSTMLLVHACATPVSPSSVVGLTSSRPDPSASAFATSSSTATSTSARHLARHYTQVQFSLAAQIPLPDRPFFGLRTRASTELALEPAPFDSLELTSRRDSTLNGKGGITIERNEEVTVVTLPKTDAGAWHEEVEEVEKW